MILHEVIASGSSGNALLIDTLLIDCGVPFKLIKDKQIESVYITHRHSDHLSWSTLNALLNNGVEVYTPKVNKRFFKDKLYENQFNLVNFVDTKKELIILNSFSKFKIKFTKVEHDVPNYALNMDISHINCDQNLKWFHATDLAHTRDLKAPNYEVYSIETNYCEHKLKHLQKFASTRTKKGYKFNRFNRTEKSHLSKQEALTWVNSQKGDKFVKLIKLHKSQKAYK